MTVLSRFSQFYISCFIICIILLAVLCFSLCAGPRQYLNWSDTIVFVNNSALDRLDVPHLKAVFNQRINGFYTPLAGLTFLIERQLFGLSPVVSFLINFFCHIATALAVLFFLRRINLGVVTSLLAVLLWAVHPVTISSVVHIASRAHILSMLFAVFAAIYYFDRGGRFYSVKAIICAALSMIASPLAMILPGIFMLFPSQFKIFSKDWWIKLVPFLVLSIITVWINQQALVFNDTGLLAGCLNSLWAVTALTGQWVLPLVVLPLNFFPDHQNFLLINLVVILLVMVIFARIKFLRPAAMMAGIYVLSMFLVGLFSYWMPGIFFCAQRMYVPGLLLAIAFAVGIRHFYRYLFSQEYFLAYGLLGGVGVLIVGLCLLSIDQSHIWRSESRLWQYQVAHQPNTKTYNYLALSYWQQPVYQQAITNYRLKQLWQNKAEDKQGEEALRRVNELVMLLQKGIHANRTDTDSYVNLARLYQQAGDLESAAAWYENALKVNPKEKSALLNLGLMREQEGDAAKAMVLFNQLLADYPDDEKVYVQLIRALNMAVEKHPKDVVYLEKREEVVASYEQLLKRNKYTAVDCYNLAFLYEQISAWDQAERYYHRAIEIKPNYPQAWYKLAGAYQHSGDLTNALASYQRFIHLSPGYAPAYMNLGIIHNALNDVDKAQYYYQKAIDIDPKNADAYFNLGYLLESKGQLQQAIAMYEQAIDNDGRYAEAYYNLGNVYASLGQTAEAIASYIKTVAINPNHQSAYVNLSILSFKARDVQGALRYLEQAQLLGYSPPAEYLKALDMYRKK